MLTKVVRRILTGRNQNYQFQSVDILKFNISNEGKTDLYIHVPFCKSTCPYCPYNRVEYDGPMAIASFQALKKEIAIYAAQTGHLRVNSIYIGGGTPTCAVNELLEVLALVRQLFVVEGDIALETTVADISADNLSRLKLGGVNMLGLGVQTFHDKYLQFLGRNYPASAIMPAIKTIKDYHFKGLNLDLMWAFPGQTCEEMISDLDKALAVDPDQITMYPLFTFPYSAVGTFLKLKKVVMPSLFLRKKMYSEIFKYFAAKNYTMSSVWSFKRNDAVTAYSSVTRADFIGLGAGAGSRRKNIFYFNTFNIEAYIKRIVVDNQLPVAIAMPVLPKLSRYYRFYWMLYQGSFILDDFYAIADLKMRCLVRIFLWSGMCKKKSQKIYLTELGSFWIHLAQNYFVLNYINKVWSAMKKEAFPDQINL